MSKKSSVCNGEGSVCNQSGGFSVTHTGKAKIYGRHNVPPVGNGCPTRWDNHSQRVGQRLFGVANYTICRKRTKTGVRLFSSEGKFLSTRAYTVAYTFYFADLE